MQVDVSTTRRYGGAGLGLSIVRELVERMGGWVGCESIAGRGSTFWFELPAEIAEEAPDERADRRYRGKRVLMADDRRVNRQMLDHHFRIGRGGA